MAGGRPGFMITEEVIKQVEDLAAQGLYKYEMADVLGIHYDTFNEKCKANPEFSDAVERGQSKGIAEATQALRDRVLGGDVNAIKYYLNNVGKRWSEKQTHEVSGPDGGSIKTESVIDASKLSTAALKELAAAKNESDES